MRVVATAHNEPAAVALRAYEQVLGGIRGEVLMAPHLSFLPLAGVERVYVCGAGKASVPMARACVEFLGPRCAGGLVVTKDGHAEDLGVVDVVESGHPLLDERSIDAGRRMLDFARERRVGDFVIFCLSGGASALLECPLPGVTLDDLRTYNRILLSSGATIDEINQVRTYFSEIKGGGLARAFGSTPVHCFVMNDVAGLDPCFVGSGPLRHISTLRSKEILLDAINSDVRLANTWHDNWKRPTPPAIPHTLIGDHLTVRRLAIDALPKDLEIIEVDLVGERWQRADAMLAALRPGQAIVATGEPVVTVHGTGRGGRCQEMALAAALTIEGRSNVAVLCGSTDGTDGPTDHSGGLVDGDSIKRFGKGRAAAEKMLANNDSEPFLAGCGGLIDTGPTGSNLNDLVIATAR